MEEGGGEGGVTVKEVGIEMVANILREFVRHQCHGVARNLQHVPKKYM